MEAGISHAPLTYSVWEISRAFAIHHLVLESWDHETQICWGGEREREREESVRSLENLHPQK
jgi:hypothetical protein